MITLIRKDRSSHGNGILYGGDDGMSIERLLGEVSDPKPLFYVETDFGNHMKLTWTELIQMYDISQVCDYNKWKSARRELQEEPNLIQRNSNNDHFSQDYR